MICIYSHTTSSRLHYILQFIFEELLHTSYTVTTNFEEFEKHDGVKINYSNKSSNSFTIQPHSLLFEENINEQIIDAFIIKEYKAFFKTNHSNTEFDLFAASFYLLSRYEEYLPHTKDIYGRYAHENAIAFKENFLDIPLVNIWIIDFTKTLQSKYSSFSFQLSTFNFQPTYDIDVAYTYKHKGVIRNIGGFLKSPTLQRIKVLLGLQKDPFDSYDELHTLHNFHKLAPIYFFLVAEKNGIYDKNILPTKNAMQHLILQHAKKYTVGIHPSWQSNDATIILQKEKKLLENIANKKIVSSRQHYIKFNLPEGYNKLIEAGITDDYSMGYGSINGFRASVACSFNWFNLQKNEVTSLRIHPFCYMDANSYYEQKLTTSQAFDELMHYYKVCKENNGTLITIFHNNFLGTDNKFAGWLKMYQDFFKRVQLKS